MNEAERYWAKFFKDICPYTGKKCDDWNCSECEVEKAEREFAEGEERMDERNYFVEDAKSEQILFKGTKEECDEWTDEYIKENPERALIIRKGQKK